MVDGISLIAFILTGGRLLLNMNMFDAENNLALQIRNNALEMSTDAWDIQQVGQSIIIRNASRDIFLDMRFEVPNVLHIERGRLLCNGVEIILSPKYILLANSGMCFSGTGVENFSVGLKIGEKELDLRAAFAVLKLNRYQWLDTRGAIAIAERHFAQIEAIQQHFQEVSAPKPNE